MYLIFIHVPLMTKEELKNVDNAMLSTISFGLETSIVYYVVFSLFFLFHIGAYMVSNLSFLLQVSPINGGQSEGIRHNPFPRER